MRWFLTFAWLLLSAAAFSQSIEGGGGLVVTPPVFVPQTAAYSGPGDIVSGASSFWSCVRAYNLAYATGSNAGCNIRRASDSHACDVLIATNGTWGNTANCGTGGDNGQTAASFCTSTSCFVTEAYDQTGNTHNASQATAGNQPGLQFTTGASSFAGDMVYNSASQQLATSNVFTQAQPFSVSHVTFGVTPGANTFLWVADPNATFQNITFHLSGAQNQYKFGAGGTTMVSISLPSGGVTIQAVFNSTTSIANIGGTATTGLNAGAVGETSNNFLGNDSFSQALVGEISEFGFWPSGFNSTQYGNLCHNDNVYFSLGLSC